MRRGRDFVKLGNEVMSFFVTEHKLFASRLLSFVTLVFITPSVEYQSWTEETVTQQVSTAKGIRSQ